MSRPNPLGFIPEDDVPAVTAERQLRDFLDENNIGAISPPPGSQPVGSPFPSEDGSQGLGGFVPRRVMDDDGGVDGLPLPQGQKRDITEAGEDDGAGGFAKASQQDMEFLYEGEHPDLDDTSSVFESAGSSFREGSSGKESSVGSNVSATTLFNIRRARELGGGGSTRFTPPDFTPFQEASITQNIAENILPDIGVGLGAIVEAEFERYTDVEFLRDIGSVGKGLKVAGGFFCRSLVTAGTTIYKILNFATRSKLNMIIVLGICGAAYKNCPYAAYVFDFLISNSLPAIRYLGQVTGFSDGIINVFKWLGSALGIDKLIELLEAIKTAIPSADEIKAIIEEAAKETAKGVAGLTAANTARDLIINRMMTTLQETAANTETLNTAMDLLNSAAPQAAPSVLQTMLTAAASGVGSGVGQSAGYLGVRSLIGAVVGTNPAFAALQNGAGKKRRRRTMRHKKRNQTKRRVKHGKRRQTKKRQNKRTKTRSKQ